MTPADDERRSHPQSFAARRTDVPSTGPDARRVLATELDKIERRIQRVVDAGRDDFGDGSPSYDMASIAVQRLAALFEDDDRLGPLIESVATDRERKGIIATRNYTAHLGYAAMDDDTFWETVAVQVPAFIARVRSAHGI